MHPQLQQIEDDFRRASERLARLAETVPAELWPRRPEAERWSVAECVAHLNLTAAAFLPPLRQALAGARPLDGPAPARYRRDPLGWLLWRVMPPPVRFRVRTAAPFVPQATAPPAELIAEFERMQADQIACLQAADGLPLQRLHIRSPFDPRVRYNAYAALSILPRHQHRHLWQAEQAVSALSGHA